MTDKCMPALLMHAGTCCRLQEGVSVIVCSQNSLHVPLSAVDGLHQFVVLGAAVLHSQACTRSFWAVEKASWPSHPRRGWAAASAANQDQLQVQQSWMILHK